MFLRHFLHSLLVNLPLLASLEEKSTHRELDCFLEIGNRDSLEKDVLADEVAEDRFILFWEAVAEPEVEAFLILRYLLIVALEILKEWKVAITLVE